jgi:NADPH:quinone reductase-like Zn-dependent oxidoreductase
VTEVNNRVVVTRHGAPDVLELVQDDLPEPMPAQVRVRVLAAGVSAFDLIYRRWGHLPGSPDLPFTLGEDVVGEVDEVGPQVSTLEVGQIVAGGTWVLGVGGGYAEYVCLPADQLVAVPAGVDPTEAVCLVVNYLTAHQHLHQIGRVRRGERVLVHGAAGGVGTALLQLGKLAGSRMYGTASTGALDRVAELGATPIDYRTEDFRERIRTLTDDGVDVVIDPIGGARHLWQSYRALRPGGRLVWLGSSAVETQGLRVGITSMAMMFLLRLVPDGRSAPRCPTMGQYAEANHAWYRDTLTELLALLADHQIAPVVAQRLPLAEAARAHELLEEGGHSGKFVLVTDAHHRTTDR